MVGSLVSFVDGLPFKPGYRRYQIKSVAGIDDFAAIREVVTRRIQSLQERDELLRPFGVDVERALRSVGKHRHHRDAPFAWFGATQ